MKIKYSKPEFKEHIMMKRPILMTSSSNVPVYTDDSQLPENAL